MDRQSGADFAPEVPLVEQCTSFVTITSNDSCDERADAGGFPCVATNNSGSFCGVTNGVRGQRFHKAALLLVAGAAAMGLVCVAISHVVTHESRQDAVTTQGQVQLVGKGRGPCEVGMDEIPGMGCKGPSLKALNSCAKAGEDCSEAQCCREKGMQCYARDGGHARCKAECVAGSPDPTDEEPKPWKCTKLGDRTEGRVPPPNTSAVPAAWVKDKCSLPGHDCSESTCCAWGNMQCFEKSPGKWASCKEACFPDGPDFAEPKANTWTCKKLGHRTPGKGMKAPEHVKLPGWVKGTCSKPGEDCSDSGCCAWEGMQCFQKDEHWASCKAGCTAGPDLLDVKPNKWTCKPMGPRTPGVGPAPPAKVEVAKWVKSFCGTSRDDCSKSMCCREPGMQCYRKTDNYATCRASCTPGPDPTDIDNTPWSCKALGPRTPGAVPVVPLWKMKPADWVASKCSKSGTDCSHTKCCAEEGAQCYKKSDGWAMCRSDCSAGPDPADADSHWWSCEPLGSRTPGKATPVSKLDWKAPAWVAKECAHDGPCLQQGCCAGAGMQCYKKADGWAVCKASCYAGAPDFTDIESTPWTCDKVGGRTPGRPVLPDQRAFTLPKWLDTTCSAPGKDCSKTRCCSQMGMQCYQKGTYWGLCKASCTNDDEDGPWSCKKLGPRTPKPWGKPSLFCLAISRSMGYEIDIMKAQIREGAGIFGCDETAILCSDPLYLGDGVRVIKFDGATVGVSKDGTAGNAQLFMNVWAALKGDKAINEADWTIKVDPDAVIVPDRLRRHLSPHTGKSVYFKNCGAYQGPEWPMMFGALEAFSKGAMQAYYGGESRCRNELQWASWGEDVYMAKCMDHLNVGAVVDLGLVFDGVCRGSVNCQDVSVAAFHPFKNAGSWMACWRSTKR